MFRAFCVCLAFSILLGWLWRFWLFCYVVFVIGVLILLVDDVCLWFMVLCGGWFGLLILLCLV